MFNPQSVMVFSLPLHVSPIRPLVPGVTVLIRSAHKSPPYCLELAVRRSRCLCSVPVWCPPSLTEPDPAELLLPPLWSDVVIHDVFNLRFCSPPLAASQVTSFMKSKMCLKGLYTTFVFTSCSKRLKTLFFFFHDQSKVHLCALIMLFNQHLETPHLSVGLIIVASEDVLTNTDFHTFLR